MVPFALRRYYPLKHSVSLDNDYHEKILSKIRKYFDDRNIDLSVNTLGESALDTRTAYEVQTKTPNDSIGDSHIKLDKPSDES